MHKYRQFNIKMFKEDEPLLQFIMKQEKALQSEAVRIALAKYTEHFEMIKTLKSLVKQQEEILNLIKEGR